MTTDKKFTRVNDPNDLEVIVPEPVPEHPGFYYFPHDSRLGVSKNSEVVNIKTGKIIKPSVSKSDKLYILITSPNVKAKAYALHRVIALTFIGRPSRHLDKEKSRLEVNHIDGNRYNNDANNLEWVTGSENVLHARDNNLKTDNYRVLMKSIVTGVVSVCISVCQCARDFDISKPTLHKHLKSRNTLKLHKEGYLFRYDTGEGWPVDHPDEIKEFHSGNEIGSAGRTFGVVAIMNLKNGQKFVSDTISNISRLLKLSYNTLWRKITKQDNFEIGDYRFKVLSRN